MHGLIEKLLHLLKRYPVSPWDWEGTTLDMIVNHSHLETLSEQWRPAPVYDSAWVIGQNQGVMINTKRSGTAGGLPAPQVVDGLITAV